MSFEAEFVDMMPDTIRVKTEAATRNFYGEAAHQNAVAHRARVVHKTKVVRLDSGEEVVTRTHAYVAGAHGITPGSLVILPSGATAPVVTVEQYPDEEGAHHEVLYFGEARE